MYLYVIHKLSWDFVVSKTNNSEETRTTLIPVPSVLFPDLYSLFLVSNIKTDSTTIDKWWFNDKWFNDKWDKEENE